MQIPAGAALVNTKTGDVAVVVGGNKVAFDGEEYALSALTKKLLSLPYYVSPAAFWTYEGKVFGDIYNETYSG
jgi:hypothetical protein